MFAWWFLAKFLPPFQPLFQVVALHWLLVVLARHLHDSIDCGQPAAPLLPILWKNVQKNKFTNYRAFDEFYLYAHSIGRFKPSCKFVWCCTSKKGSTTPLHPRLLSVKISPYQSKNSAAIKCIAVLTVEVTYKYKFLFKFFDSMWYDVD